MELLRLKPEAIDSLNAVRAELGSAVVKLTPPVVAQGTGATEINWVAVATIGYTLLMGVHLLWKWRQEYEDRKIVERQRKAGAS